MNNLELIKTTFPKAEKITEGNLKGMICVWSFYKNGNKKSQYLIKEVDNSEDFSLIKNGRQLINRSLTEIIKILTKQDTNF